MSHKKKNGWLKVDFPKKIDSELKQLNSFTGYSYPKLAVMAMRMGIKTLMNMSPDQLDELAEVNK